MYVGREGSGLIWFGWGRGDGECLQEANTQIARTEAESQQIVAQGHSHAYNTTFFI